jgi:anti-sigma factor RsiW
VSNVSEILAGAKRQRDSLSICLDGELDAAYRHAVEALDEAKKQAQREDSLASAGVSQARERLAGLREQMKAATVTFVVEAVGRKRWTELLAEHPPREGNNGDALVRFDQDGMAEALLAEGIVEPKLTDDQRTHLFEELLTEGQYNDLANLAFRLNRRGVSTGFLSDD